MTWKAILACIGCLIGPSAAYAGDVYKCNVGGTSVYQDAPCEQGTRIATPGLQQSSQPANSSLGLSGLFHQIQAANATERQLQESMDRDIARTKARLGSRANDPSSNGEAARIRAEWLPKIQAAAQRSESLRDELSRRCPNGASLNAATQTCNK
jgi:hypothetical protein